MSCSNKILISNWPQTRKFSQFLQVGKEATFDSLWSLVDHALCPIFMLWLVKILQVSSYEKFAQRLETCLLIAKADRVLCHLVMFLAAAFKIVLLFMAGFFIGLRLSKSLEIRFQRHCVHKSLNELEGWKVSGDFGLTWWLSGAASRVVSLSNYFI